MLKSITDNLLAIIRFSLEVVGIVSLLIIGFKNYELMHQKIIVGILLPLVIITLWSLFIAPKSPCLLEGTTKLVVELLLLHIPIIVLWLNGYYKTATIIEINVLVTSFYFYLMK